MMAVVIAGARVNVMTAPMAGTMPTHVVTALAIAMMAAAKKSPVASRIRNDRRHREGGDYNVARAGWVGDYSDPQNFLFLLQSDNKGLNYARYNNPEFDALMKKAAAETNIEARAKILNEAEKFVTRDLPYIPILYYGSKNLVSSKIEGWSTNLRDAHATRFLSIK